MSQPVVLIVFYSRCGSTEKLALAAAVGAVQARALIRLRRLPDADADAGKTLEQFPECKDTLLRMRREYVAPAEADVLGADGLILAAPPGFTTSSPEWSGYMDLLTRLASSRMLKLKVVGIVDSGSEAAYLSFSQAVAQMGLSPAPRAWAPSDAVERALALGRWTGQSATR